ncbi:MAG: signal peptide peptidase SppA [Sedimentisphaerales bacterium]
MDFGNINDSSQQQLGGIPSPQPAPAAKKGSGWKVFWGIITGLSMLGNVMLFLMLIGVGIVAFAGRGERKYTEEVIEEGPRSAKIAIVSINGVIDEQQAQDVYWQLKTARDDKNVKGLIIRVNSPGGTFSGSDQVHNEIIKYRADTNQPVVAFMQDVAASGGYYSSVACNEIIAEPTAITGSIGVIMEYLVLQQLLEDKLGINPIVVKAGSKKDWPSNYQMPTDEQLQYMQERIVDPAYKRFVQVVVDGRSGLTEEDVNRLADGSIYWADKALEEKLIDGIGYLTDAIDKTKSLAGVKKAQVVEYRKPFSIMDMLSTKTNVSLKIDRRTLYEVAVPQALYLWTGPQ